VYGKQAIEDSIKKATPLFNFYLKYIKNKLERTNQIQEKSRYIEEVLRKIAGVFNPVKRELLLSEVSDFLGLKLKNLEENLNLLLKTQKKVASFYYPFEEENCENRALYELQAELLYIISKDKEARKKSQELQIKNYIITPFYQRLYEAIMSEPAKNTNITQVMEDDPEYTQHISYLCKFEFMNDYEITTGKLEDVIDNLKNCVLRRQMEKMAADELEKAIELKKQLLQI
jgi:hypothetical protein